LYPEKWQTILTGHHALAAELRGRNAAALGAGFSSLAGNDAVLFSSEDFSGLEQPELLLLKELLGDQPARFVFYCRRWSELLPSCWQEDVKQGSGETLPEFYLPRLCDPARSNILNFNIVLDRFAAVFGEAALDIVSYSNIIDRKQDMVRHFVADILGISDDDLRYPDPDFPNSALDYLDIEIIRVLNIISQKYGGHRSPDIRLRYLRNKAKLDLNFLTEQIAAERARISIDNGASALNWLYSQISERYRLRIVGEDKSIFAQQKGKPYVYVRPRYLLAGRVMDEFLALHEEVAGVRSPAAKDAALSQ
jgi:hypothetical protein